MLSHLHSHNHHAAQAYGVASSMPMPMPMAMPPPATQFSSPPLLPSLRMPATTPSFHHFDQRQHNYAEPTRQYPYHHHRQHHHHHPYQRSFQSLPPLPVPRPVQSTAPPTMSSPTSDNAHKCSLAFILSQPSQQTTTVLPSLTLQRSQSDAETSSDGDSVDSDPLDRPHGLKHKRRASGSPVSTGSKSKYCIVEGCTSRAKHARKCWRHGGSVKCKVQDCINRAKSRGVCWSHGGGTTCSHANCGTIAVSHGFCWAHGGGKRCEVGGCSRPAYERTQNLCSTHFKQQKTAAKAVSAVAAPN